MKVIICKEPNDVSVALATMIRSKLNQNRKVLWLVSGGSSIPVAAGALKILENVDQKNLFVTLVDDIYENNIHIDTTNWHKFLSSGFVRKGALCQGILQQGLTPQQTSMEFNELLKDRLAWADDSIGQFGIGAGYHTGGIQPFSIAAKQKERLAIAYNDKKVLRITVTPGLIARLDIVVVNSFGADKLPLVGHFKDSGASIEEEPTQALKLAKETFLYTDAE